MPSSDLHALSYPSLRYIAKAPDPLTFVVAGRELAVGAAMAMGAAMGAAALPAAPPMAPAGGGEYYDEGEGEEYDEEYAEEGGGA